VSDTPIIASALRPRIASDPWGHALGIEFLDLRRDHCRLRPQLRPHLADVAFGAVATGHAVAHRLTS